MSDSLTTLISKVQIILGDDGTIFTTAAVTAAVRQTLADFNRRIPQYQAGLITGINDQYEYEVSDLEPLAVKILDVLRQGENADEIDIPLTYDEYIEDERLWFRLRSPVTTSDTLIVRYTQNHTISGLDSATESTIQTRHDAIIVDGTAYNAVMTRATARVESINLSQNQSDNYREAAGHFKMAFELGLADAVRRSSPVGEPDTRAWNDSYHTWEQ